MRRALAYAYPYQAAWAAGGEIPGVTRLPATNVMPPGIPGRVEYNPLPGHAPGDDRPGQGQGAADGRRQAGLPDQVRLPDRRPDVGRRQERHRAGADAAGFDPQPVATTSANYVDGLPAEPEGAGQRPLERLVLATGRRVARGCPPLFQSTDIAKAGFGSNFAAFSSKAVDDRIDAIPQLLLTEQPPAWNALDKLIQTKYFPVVVTGYGGVAMMRGSKVHNVFDDPTFGMPTWKDIWIG